MLAELEDMWHSSTSHLLCTTDAAQVVDEGYSRYLLHNANRMGSITGDDASYYPSFIAASPTAGDSLDDSGRSSAAADASFSWSASHWWHTGSFAAPKPNVSPSMSGLHSGPYASGGSSIPGAPVMSVARRVLQNLRAEDEGAALHPLESSGGCYVLVLPVPPHEVVWATKAWCNMSGCELDDIVGRPLHVLPVFDSSAFVKLKSGSQRKGSLAAELEAPRSRCADLANAVSSVFCGDTRSSATVENANATSLFFKSINSRYLHRARSCHAILNVLDASSRSWNISSTQRRANTFSRRIAARLSMVAAPKPSRGPSNEAADGPNIDKTAANICSKFSLHAYPIYQRTMTTSPIAITPTPNMRVPKAKSGLFGVGSLGQ